MSESLADELDAAEYVLGTLSPPEARSFEERLRENADLRAATDRWASRLSQLEPLSAPATPEQFDSDGLWARIDAQIEQIDSEADELVGTTSQVFSEGRWRKIAIGVEMKLLHRHAEEGCDSFLLRLAPGSRIPTHAHDKAEECVVLEGEIRIGPARFGPGDFHLAHAGSKHPDIHSDNGALIYLRAEQRGTLSWVMTLLGRG